MLKINTNFKKYKIPLITVFAVVGGAFLFQYLIFIPEYSSAEEIGTPVYDESKKDTRTLADIDYMQEVTSGICERTPEADTNGNNQYQLTDERDGKKYWVAKLKDGNCWMTSNMDNDAGKMKFNADNGYQVIYGGYYDYENAINACNIQGWQLPVDLQYVDLASGISEGRTLAAAPYLFQYAGGIINGSLNNVGLCGYYWSSTYVNVTMAHAFFFNPSEIVPSTTGDRYHGRSVRCVARDDVPDVKIPEIDNPNVSVTVDKILTMKLDSNEVNIEPKTNEIMTGNFTATVSSNAGYDIQLSAAEDSSTALVNKKDNVTVAEIPASNNIQVGNNGWGIKCTEDENCVVKNYNALTLFNNPQIYFSSANGAFDKATKFEVGIGIPPSLPSGTYSTNILVTASQK